MFEIIVILYLGVANLVFLRFITSEFSNGVLSSLISGLGWPFWVLCVLVLFLAVQFRILR